MNIDPWYAFCLGLCTGAGATFVLACLLIACGVGS